MSKADIDILFSADSINRADNDNGIMITITPKNNGDIARLEQLKNYSGYYEVAGLGELAVGCRSEFEFIPYNLLCYIDYKDVLINVGLDSTNLKDYLEASFFHKWYCRNEPNKVIPEENIDIFCKLVKILKTQGYIHNKSILFFHKHALNVPLSINESKATKLLDEIKNFTDEQHQAVRLLESYFDEEESAQHANEKKKIFAAALAEVLSGEDVDKISLADIVNNINKISNHAQGQYDLYIENFSYEKFVKKLEENNEKFISRINDTVSKIITQILALPIATATISILSKGSTIITLAVALSLLGYSIICFLALSIQSVSLEIINKEVKSFESQEKIPKAMKGKWESHRSYLEVIIRRQYLLAFMMVILLSGCYFYALNQIFNTYEF